MNQAINPTVFDPASSRAIPAYDSSFIDLPLESKVSTCISTVQRLVAEGKHLVVSTSYGKDSAVMLAIVLEALRRISDTGVEIPEVLIVNSDTLLENPKVANYAKNEISKTSSFMKTHGIPGKVTVVNPSLSNDYLVNLLGGRSLASLSDGDANCSMMMKVSPIMRHKNRVFKKYGKDNVVTLVGKRWDESDERMRNMVARGENHFTPIKNDAGELLLSAIANFTEDDIWMFIGKVTNGQLNTYSDFKDLMNIYRESEGGECAVVAYMDGKPRNTGCGQRHGCHICLRVSDDKSMKNMLKDEGNKFMRPLNDFRNYLKATHYMPGKRNWLARTVQDDGTIAISPYSYSPDHCLELLKMALSIQADENEEAWSQGIEPRFTLITIRQAIAIDVLWSRYGYQRGLTAVYWFREIMNKGMRFKIPHVTDAPKKINIPQVTYVPFADEEYSNALNGFRDPILTLIDQEDVVEKNGILYSNANVDIEFDVDEEGADLFFAFELDRAIEKYYENENVCPTSALHYFIGLGTVTLSKGSHSNYDRMIRIANQMWRHGLQPHLNDPAALIEILNGDQKGQISLI